MDFLAPATGLIAAAGSVSLLVLMYFLKLRRREVLISSTLLWRRAVQDLQVNAPFQRLRRNLLLLLQLLALSAVLLALARPVVSLRTGGAKRHVILIDRSASMNATDVTGGRLGAAKRQAKELVQSLRAGARLSLHDQGDQAMVIAFADGAKVMCNFTSDKRRLAEAIDSIEPTDGGSSLAEAVAVARAFAQSPGEDANNRSAVPRAQLELFSDGRVRDADKVVVNERELNFHRIGSASENLAIVAMQARRSYERADEVNVFATLASYARAATDVDVQLAVDGNVRSVRTVRLPPCRTGPGGAGPAGEVTGCGKASITFSLSHPGAGVLEVRQLRPDAMPADDAAWAVLQRPRKLSALLVTDGNVALTAALESCPLARLDVRRCAEFDAMDPAALGVEGGYDVIVLDRHVPAHLPRGRYIVFGRPPAGIGAAAAGQVKQEVLVDWQARHPVLQHLNLTPLFVATGYRLTLPRDAVVLAEFSASPAMAVVRRKGGAFLLVAFDVMETNWPFEPSFAMFCYNATKYLGMEIGRVQRRCLKVGQPIELAGEPGAPPAEVRAPDGRTAKVPCDPSGTLRCGGTFRAGVYSVAATGRAVERFAVNLLDEEESNLHPPGEIVLAGQPTKAQTAGGGRANRELWPLLAAVALVLVCLEWFVYNSKMRL